MRWYEILSLFPICLLHSLEWSMPVTLFTSGSYDGVSPQMAVHPLNQTAKALWIAQGSNHIVYASDFDGSNWSTAASLHSSNAESSLQLASDGAGLFTAVWSSFDGTNLKIQAAENTANMWSAPQALQTVSVDPNDLFLNLARESMGAALISWQDGDSQLNGLAYLNGQASSIYTLNELGTTPISSSLTPTYALYTVADGAYLVSFDLLSAPSPVANVLMYPLVLTDPSHPLPLKSNPLVSLAVFQDGRSQFFLSAIQTGSNWNYSVIDAPYEPISNSQIALSAATGLVATIWQCQSGLVKAAIFNGRRWTHGITLSSHGAAPTIAINPVNNHVIAVWADLTNTGANSIQFSEFDSSSWSDPVLISSTGAFVDAPQIDINPSGQAVVVWTRKVMSGSKMIIEAASGS